jgi:hypothetical protein
MCAIVLDTYEIAFDGALFYSLRNDWPVLCR